MVPSPLLENVYERCDGDQLSTARTSLSRRINSASPSTVTSVPLYFPYNTLSPTFTSIGTRLPSSKRPGPTATISPCWGFSFAVSGMYSPPRIDSVSSSALMTTRSANGATFTEDEVLAAIQCSSELELQRVKD